MNTYQPASGQPSCLACPVGTEQPLTGQTECVAIPLAKDRKCWKVKDLKNPKLEKFEGQQADDEFRGENVDVKKPFLVCAPADTGNGVEDLEAFECCYKIKADKVLSRPSIQVEGDLGGSIQLELKKPFLLCEPCTRSAIP